MILPIFIVNRCFLTVNCYLWSLHLGYNNKAVITWLVGLWPNICTLLWALCARGGTIHIKHYQKEFMLFAYHQFPLKMGYTKDKTSCTRWSPTQNDIHTHTQLHAIKCYTIMDTLNTIYSVIFFHCHCSGKIFPLFHTIYCDDNLCILRFT